MNIQFFTFKDFWFWIEKKLFHFSENIYIHLFHAILHCKTFEHAQIGFLHGTCKNNSPIGEYRTEKLRISQTSHNSLAGIHVWLEHLEV